MSDFQYPRGFEFLNTEPAPPLIDLVVDPDGRTRAGHERPAALERRKLLELRALLQQVQTGEAPLDALTDRLQVLVTALQGATAKFQTFIQDHPEHTPYWQANIEGYGRGVEALAWMIHAVHSDDADILWQGMAAFESALQDLDQLVAPE